MISVRNLTKSYALKNRRHYVFKDVSFDFPGDKNIGILGPNGAGKSTLLRILGGIDHADSGEIERNASLSWPLGLRGGFVGHMTGRENCRMICNAYGMQKDQLREKIEYIKELSKIGDYFDQPVAYYSSGMGSRLGFALSMAFDFDYFLIDEITAVGDGHFKQLAKNALEEKRATSKIIMVSHSMGDLKRFCDVAVLIKDGTVTIYEDFDEAIEAYLPKTDAKTDAKTLFAKRKSRPRSELDPDEQDSDLGSLHALIADRFGILNHAIKEKEELSGRAEDTLYKAATIFLQVGQQERALALIERAIEIDDCRVGFWVSRANILWRLKRLKACHEAFTSGLQLDPRHPGLLLLKAEFHFDNNEIEEADDSIRLALLGNPDFLGAWLLLARIEMDKEEYEKALDAIDVALELNPKHRPTMHLKAEILFQAGMGQEALACSRKAFTSNTANNEKDWHKLAEELLTALEDIETIHELV